MWIIVLFLSLLFIIIAFIINKNNAVYLVSGFNTMPEEDRQMFDLDGYLLLLKTFFRRLGIMNILLFTILYLLFDEVVAFVSFVLLTILASTFLIIKGKKYYHPSILKKYDKINNWAAGILGIVFFGLVFLFYWGLEDNELYLQEHKLEIKGMYGEDLAYSSIHNISLVETLPDLKMRTNGMGLGSYLKGFFRTKEDKSVKLLVQKDRPPFLKIEAATNIIYWNHGNADVPAIYHEIKNKIN